MSLDIMLQDNGAWHERVGMSQVSGVCLGEAAG